MHAHPTQQEIQELAYQLWIQRGCPRCSEQEDWEEAEYLLKAGSEAQEGADG